MGAAATEGCGNIPKMGSAVSTDGQQRVPGPAGAGLGGAKEEPEHRLGWEMCESVCHAAF